MTCIHLQKLYQLCHEHDLKLGASDLIRVVCHQCGQQEVCPSTLTDEYDFKQAQATTDPNDEQQAEDSTSSS